jgi:hypothetical protein
MLPEETAAGIAAVTIEHGEVTYYYLRVET